MRKKKVKKIKKWIEGLKETNPELFIKPGSEKRLYNRTKKEYYKNMDLREVLNEKD